jgi:polar amino acid transport system substrate-binding protein
MGRWLLSLLILFAACGNSSQSYDYAVAFDPAWHALELPGREASIRAFSIELIEEIAKVQNVKIALFDRSWDNLMFGLQKKEYNAILSTMQPYLFYEKLYNFSNPYLLIGPTLVIPTAGQVRSLDDLSGKEIAILRDSPTALILEKYPGIIQRTYDTTPQMLSDVASGALDGAVIDILTAKAFCSDLFQGKLKIAFPPLTQEGIRMVAIHDEAQDLIATFNKGLQKLKENGTYDKLMQKWNLSE